MTNNRWISYHSSSFSSYYYCMSLKYTARRKRVWQMPYIEVSQRHDNQLHVRQTMISSPIYDAQKEAYQHHGN